MISIAVIVYGGLLYGYKPYLENQIADVDEEINALAAKIPKENQEQLLRFYSQLSNLKNILDNHTIASKFLAFLEKNTNRRVFFTKLTEITSERTITLEGVTDNYDTLAQQLQAFKEAKEVERFVISDSQLNENQIRFKVQVVLSPALFK